MLREHWDVLIFANMSKHLDEDQPLYGLQGVGSKGFDEWYESIEDMAANYIQAILKINILVIKVILKTIS